LSHTRGKIREEKVTKSDIVLHRKSFTGWRFSRKGDSVEENISGGGFAPVGQQCFRKVNDAEVDRRLGQFQ
jgi:hypothetical protein